MKQKNTHGERNKERKKARDLFEKRLRGRKNQREEEEAKRETKEGEAVRSTTEKEKGSE